MKRKQFFLVPIIAFAIFLLFNYSTCFCPCSCISYDTDIQPCKWDSISSPNDDILEIDTVVIAETNNIDTSKPIIDSLIIVRGRIEIPAIKDLNWFIQHKYYVMEYDTGQRHSVWVAYVFDSIYNLKNVKRSDAWGFDPIIPQRYQCLNSVRQTFNEFGYDRGHLCASEDRVFNLTANEETFYYTNMSPQLSWFNQQIWKNFEEKVRKWAQADDCDTMYVVTGGAINPGVEVIGKLETRNNVTIPKYYFKALVKRQGDSFEGIAIWLENKKYESAKVSYEYMITIRELEEKTGINFFPNLKYALPDNPNLEDEVETRRDTSKWPL
ncbi:MAG: DNA/RNA non-specific endonuclease [Bacteroidetes bacterium]|nr:DNA/RNA non-specific endonuclease [Bacteroidota bacterium]MCL1968687.1 DNA/RNA non-specific endonuclease [Bacteroidota bacterium]